MITKKVIDKSELRNVFEAFSHCFVMFDFEEYLEKIYQNANTYIVEVNNQIAGVVIFYANDTKDGKAYITLVEVKKEYRNGALASCLLNKCVEVSHLAGMNRILLEVSNENIIAIRFYKKHGFTFVQINDRSAYMQKEL